MQIIHAFFIPVLLAVLSGMGLGGGGLFVIYLKLIGGGEQLEMQAVNLLFFIFSAGASLTFHLAKRKIYFGAVAIAAFFGVLGSLLGSAVATRIKSDILGVIFGVMLIAAGIYSFFGRESSKKKKESRKTTKKTDDV
jgi:uncharacterized membrane protein YfcA